MSARGLAVVAVALASLCPITASAASSPNPETLRAALAEPLEPNFVEAEIGTVGTLEGPFDAQAYIDYYASSGTSQSDLQRAMRLLEKNGFVAGYGRQWYVPGAEQYLYELVMVFRTATSASAMEKSYRLTFAETSGFGAFIDAGLGGDSYAATLESQGYQWTGVAFSKGDGFYILARGSNRGYMTDAALAQGRSMFALAPPNIAVGASTAGATAANTGRLVLIGALIILLMTLTAVAVLALVVLPSRQSKEAAAISPGADPRP